MLPEFKNLKELTEKFSDEDVCRKFFEDIIWQGSPSCPHCGRTNPYKLKDGKTYRCSSKACKKDFTVTVGTIFDNSKVPLSKWFMAIYLTTNHKKGISSCQLAKDISVTQATAWFMLQRIRQMGKPKQAPKFSGEVMIDHTYCGGKNKNKSQSVRKQIKQGERPSDTKIPVFGLVQKEGDTLLTVVPDSKSESIRPIVLEVVDKETVIVSDGGHENFEFMDNYQSHVIVNHNKGEYVKDGFTTNHIESVFALLKRTVYGTHHNVSGKHLQRYCVEVGHRFNTRKFKDADRFMYTIQNAGNNKLPYHTLVGKK